MNFKKYGIGSNTENKFKLKYGINERSRTASLTKNMFNIFKYKNNKKLMERQLFDNINENINFYKTMKNFRGLRHKNYYPVRGQRTHTNARKKIIKTKNFL